MCLVCGHLMVFDAELKLSNMGLDQLMQAQVDPRVLALQQARYALMKIKGPKNAR